MMTYIFSRRGLRPTRPWLAACIGVTLLLSACGPGSSGDGSVNGGALSGGPAALAVAVNPLRAKAVPDTGRSVTQSVPLSGGTLTATGADGTVYTLTVPADALLQPTEISMTPLIRLDGLDIATDAVYGVQLGPEGERFQNFVTLTVTPPAGASVPVDRQIPIGWSGADNVVSLAALDPASRDAKFKLLHFSGYALLLATKGTDATLEPLRHRLGGDAEARLQSIAAERLVQQRQGQLLGSETGSLSLDDLFKQYDEQVVKPRVAAARSSCAAGRLAIQTVLGVGRQRGLLGYPDDGGTQNALAGSLMADASFACTKEEYELCRDNHIITRMLPYYLGVKRQAELLGIAGSETTLPPTWLQDAEGAVDKCLNFELQLDSRLDYTAGVDRFHHTVREDVSSRLKLPFNIGAAAFGSGLLYVSGSRSPDPLVSKAYDVNYTHACAAVSGVQRIGAGLMGLLGYVPEEGGVAQRAKVKDFYFTPGIVPNGTGSGYSLTVYRTGPNGCESPSNTTAENDNWWINGFTTWADAFIDPNLALAIRNWTIVGGDVMATKDFTTRGSSGSDDSATVTTSLILFHKPAP